METSAKRSFASSVGIYGAGNVLHSAVPFFLLPVLTRFLTPEDYGIWALLWAIAGFIGPLVSCNAHAAVARQFFDVTGDQRRFATYVSNALLIVLAGSVTGSALLWACGPFIPGAEKAPRNWVALIGLIAGGQSISLVLLGLWTARVEPVKYVIHQVARSLFTVGLALFLVVYLHLSWRAMVLAYAAAAILFGGVAIIALSHDKLIVLQPDKKQASQILDFGVPLIPHALASTFILALDRFFIAHYHGVGATGLYVVGYQIGGLVLLLQDGFNRAWSPWLYGELTKNESGMRRRIVRFTYLYFVVILLAALVLTWLTPKVLPILVGPTYIAAQPYVFWIAIGFAFQGMYKMVAAYVFYSRRTRLLSMVSVASVALNVALNLLLVPEYGALGAAQATTATFLFTFLLSWMLSARVYPMPWLGALRPERSASQP